MSQRKRAEKLIALAQPLSDYTDQRLLGEGVRAAKALLEALDTIDRLEKENDRLFERDLEFQRQQGSFEP